MNGEDPLRHDAAEPRIPAPERTPPRRRGRRLIFSRPAARMHLERLWASLRDGIEHDLDLGHGAPWLVLAFAIGIWAYFELPREPVVQATVPAACIAFMVVWRRRTAGHPARAAMIIAAMVCGLAAADLRAALVEAPRLKRAGMHDVAGRVVAVERRESDYRLTVEPVMISRIAESAMPLRLRVSARKPAVPPEVGTGVRFRARLAPPGGAVMPGGYAFDRAAYFQGLGASGFVLGGVAAAEIPARARWLARVALRLSAMLAGLRASLADRVRETLAGDAGGIAAALIVGERGGVSEEAQEALRTAGLAHVLAISGMHMALVAGTIFFFVRAGLALSPQWALKRPIRSWAALCALIAATGYLFLSGASVATQRAYIMAAIVFLAILTGRPALTMRSVALAALAILALTPEALLHPGFQMSFAAVIALVAAYEAWAGRRRREDGREPDSARGGPLRAVRFWVTGLIMTSLIAGLATAPIAAAHFSRVAPLGLLANLAAMPLVALVIMPMAVLSVVAMPFGLDPLPLAVMGRGIDAMLAVAGTVADMTPSGGLIGAVDEAGVIACIAGLFLLAFLKTRWRLAGLLPIALGIIAMPLVGRPDVLISEDGRTVAARRADGRLAVAQGRGGRFSAENWLRADGDPAALSDRKAKEPELRCDDLGCVLRVERQATPERVAGGRADRPGPVLTIAMVRDPLALAEDCRRADIVVAPFAVPQWCGETTMVFDRDRLETTGAVAITLAKPEAGEDVLRLRAGKQAEPMAGTTAIGAASGSAARGIEHIKTVRTGNYRPWHGAAAD